MPTDIRRYLVNVKEMREKNRKICKELPKNVVTEVREKKLNFKNPVIVTFQNGDLNEKEASDFEVTLTANENSETNVEVTSPQGQVFKDSCIYKPHQKQFIAIKNRKTNKIKLVEVDNTVLINSILLSSTTTNTSLVDNVKEIRTLHKTFGGKNMATRVQQREKYSVSLLPVADDVKKAVESLKVDESFSLKGTEIESMTHLLPPCHRDAKKPSDVYKIEEILSEDELQSLREKINELMSKKFKPQEYSTFFMHCFTQAKKSDEDLNTRLAGVLFIECLIKFLKIQSRKLASKTVVLCSFSSVIHEKLLNEFCVKTESSVTRPITMRDKTLCYIIALSLICCFEVNLKILSMTTAVHLNRLTRLGQIVGVVPLTKGGHEFVLKVPLPALPKSSGRKTQKK